MIRIYRTWEWKNMSNVLGGHPQYQLVSHDELQELQDGKWVGVAIVEGEKPIHPHVAHREELLQKIKTKWAAGDGVDIWGDLHDDQTHDEIEQ